MKLRLFVIFLLVLLIPNTYGFDYPPSLGAGICETHFEKESTTITLDIYGGNSYDSQLIANTNGRYSFEILTIGDYTKLTEEIQGAVDIICDGKFVRKIGLGDFESYLKTINNDNIFHSKWYLHGS